MLKQTEEQKLTLQQYFTSQQEELHVKTQEIERVQIKHAQVKDELDDMQEVIHREREDLMDRIRELPRETSMKLLNIDKFILPSEYMGIEKRAEWADDINDWVKYTGDNIKIQKAKKKEGKVVYSQLLADKYLKTRILVMLTEADLL